MIAWLLSYLRPWCRTTTPYYVRSAQEIADWNESIENAQVWHLS